ncbi:hypothetical protein RHSIM_Rhsim03G0042200 [Rhododendron simsii]|uniref:Uncharacterized protein n=1 Tax=Rhododendron simsii TaxID=118357 RepID=A0A834LS91_RHOSS|nr:hypothetical protein RHSIM_Rhsim03G0042200 [Rhododendron simsii]
MVAAYTSNYLLLAIIVVATASAAQATLPIPGLNVIGVIVAGVFVDPANAPISVAGVNISLSCDGGATTIGTQAHLTGTIGAFEVAATNVNFTLFEESKCDVYAYVSLPNHLNASAIAHASLIPLGTQGGVELEVVNGQIVVIAKTGSSIATYLAGPFLPGALS